MAKRTKPRSCRVCGCTDDRACDGGCYWVSAVDDLCSRCAGAVEGHVVRHTREYPQIKRGPAKGLHRTLCVATCECGTFEAKLPPSQHRKLDTLVRKHWRETVALAGGSHV